MFLNSIKFKVAGVTFKNEEGKDVQKEIKRILNEYKKNDYFGELYGGYTNSEIKEMDLNVSEYEGYKFPAKIIGDEYSGESCFKIYFKTYNNEDVHIGYVPKEHLEELVEWLDKKNLQIKGTLEVIGGKYKYCELYEEDYEEKERVAIKELTYGIEISLDFFDNQIDPKYEQIKKEEKKIIRQNKYMERLPYIVVGIISIPFIWIIYKVFSFIIWLFN